MPGVFNLLSSKIRGHGVSLVGQYVVNLAVTLFQHPVIGHMGGKHKPFDICIDYPGKNSGRQLMKKGLIAGGTGVVHPNTYRAECADSQEDDWRTIR